MTTEKESISIDTTAQSPEAAQVVEKSEASRYQAANSQTWVEDVDQAVAQGTTVEKIREQRRIENADPEFITSGLRKSRKAIADLERRLEDEKHSQRLHMADQQAIEAAKGEFQAAQDELERASSCLKYAQEFEPIEKDRIDGALYAIQHPGQLADFFVRLVALERAQEHL